MAFAPETYARFMPGWGDGGAMDADPVSLTVRRLFLVLGSPSE